MTTAVYPGSFDPITLGHLDVARRARGLFDEVILAVGANSSKSYLFDSRQRLDLARLALQEAGVGGLRAEPMDGLLVDFCAEHGAAAIVKGLRGGADFDVEQPMALMNRHLSGVETVFLLADPALAHVASSLVKDVARHAGRIDDLVPAHVAAALASRAAPASTPAPTKEI
ncbi:pantetheine-phosphate adenylyltransferase [Actinobaculum sp. oral taxon 183 str. F0552]|uniref:pantetheine-phosphate adenylyltransferase n=1 Tax=Actinobaculum sp. oral taxon 183 TaxID=712888 RepID=UPI0003979161|nr:pantetheine-phosphate adenylyltransferase [Actinobaculum sp. oral taxon 183]ERH19399.1 pantetheine-phosphate adenylyltransferase [Actinobaculum sp. oral taxon 183 str. F0552]